MSNEKKPENPSEALVLDHAPKERHYWFMDGMLRSLLPRLEEIEDPGELFQSESTLGLIDYLFREYEINLGELAQSQLIALSKAMPLILEDFVRLDYSLFKPELFECAKAFGSRVEEAVKERGLESRERVAEVLKD